MKIKSLIAATALALSSVGAFAGSSTFADGEALFNNDTFAADVSTFTQTITLTGLASGMYEVAGSIAGSFLSFSSITLDGHTWDLSTNAKGVAKYGEVLYIGSEPVTLTISGNNLAGATVYAGSISVTAVPEPETFAMMLAGLGLMGSIARRRNRKNNV